MVRKPLSQKEGNAQHIDLTNIPAKNRYLSLSRSKATRSTTLTLRAPERWNEKADNVVNSSLPTSHHKSNAETSKLSNSSIKQSYRTQGAILKSSYETNNLPSLFDDGSLHTSTKGKSAAIKRRKTLSDTKTTACSKDTTMLSNNQSNEVYDLDNDALAITPDRSVAAAVAGKAVDHSYRTTRTPSPVEDSPVYNEESFLSSSPPSPLFYERIKPVVRPGDDLRFPNSLDLTDSQFQCNSPLAAKEKRNKEKQIRKANLKLQSSKTINKYPTPSNSRPLLTEPIDSTSRRLTVPHSNRKGTNSELATRREDENTSNRRATQSRSQSKGGANRGLDLPLQTCPICDKAFPTSIIEEHANDCIGEIDNGRSSRPQQHVRHMQQTLLWPFKKAKPFVVYRDNNEEDRHSSETPHPEITQPEVTVEVKECPICHENFPVLLLQQHVEAELDDLTSGATTSENNSDPLSRNESRAESDIPISQDEYTLGTSSGIFVDVYSSDSDCSVIDLVAENPIGNRSPIRLTESPPPPSDDRQRERSLSPLEGFQDIRQLMNDDPGYKMYFQQFDSSRKRKSSASRARSQAVADQDGAQQGEPSTPPMRKPARNPRWSRGRAKFRRPRYRPKK